MPRTPGPTGTSPGNSTSNFSPSRVRATEQMYSGRYPMTARGTKRTNVMGGFAWRLVMSLTGFARAGVHLRQVFTCVM